MISRKLRCLRVRSGLSSVLVLTASIFLSACSEQEPVAANSTPDQRVQHLQERPRQIVQRRSIHEGDQLHREEFAIKGKVDSKLPIYEIKIAPAHIEQMDMNPRGEQTYPATFTANGVAYENVKIRYRGQWGRTWPKKPLKIFFNDDKQFDDQKRLNLNSSFRDPSFIRETVAYHVYRTAGVPSSRSQLVRVHMNGEFRGLYVQVEQPDKSFLKWHNLKGAAIIKANSKMKASDERTYGDLDEFRMHYEQETDKDEDAFPQLKKFCDKMENAKNADEFFEKNVDLEKYVNYLAASALCQNWDGYNKNHFMVLDRDGSKKWFVLPWDLDRAMGDHWDWSFGRADLPIALGTEEIPAVTGWNRMQDRFFSSPKLRARLADRIQGLLEKEFTTEKLDPIIDQLHASIRPEAELDYKRWPNPGMEWWRDEKPGLDAHVKVVKQFIRDRRDYLKRELPKLRGNQSARAALN